MRWQSNFLCLPRGALFEMGTNLWIPKIHVIRQLLLLRSLLTVDSYRNFSFAVRFPPVNPRNQHRQNL